MMSAPISKKTGRPTSDRYFEDINYVRSKLSYELHKAPRCGLCSHFPVTPSEQWFCPIYNDMRHRRSRAPKLKGDMHFYCFTPYSAIAYQRYLEFVFMTKRALNQSQRKKRESLETYLRKKKEYNARPEVRERAREMQKRRRAENPIPHREEVKKYRREHPEWAEEQSKKFRERHREEIRIKQRDRYRNSAEVREQHFIREQINQLDPFHNVFKRFYYARKCEELGRSYNQRTPEQKAKRREKDQLERKRRHMMKVPFDTHLTLEDQKQIEENKQILGNYSELMPKIK